METFTCLFQATSGDSIGGVLIKKKQNHTHSKKVKTRGKKKLVGYVFPKQTRVQIEFGSKEEGYIRGFLMGSGQEVKAVKQSQPPA